MGADCSEWRKNRETSRNAARESRKLQTDKKGNLGTLFLLFKPLRPRRGWQWCMVHEGTWKLINGSGLHWISKDLVEEHQCPLFLLSWSEPRYRSLFCEINSQSKMPCREGVILFFVMHAFPFPLHCMTPCVGKARFQYLVGQRKSSFGLKQIKAQVKSDHKVCALVTKCSAAE